MSASGPPMPAGPDRLDVVLLNAPGRFPTVMHDVGPWWDAAAEAGHEVRSISLNYHWWRVLCSAEIAEILASALPGTAQQAHRDLRESGGEATRALDALLSPVTYLSMEAYSGALSKIDAHLACLNASQSEFSVSLSQGPCVRALDYSRSTSVAGFAATHGLLSETVRRVLERAGPPGGFAAFRITSEFELLTAALASSGIRALRPDAHIALIDHGYENFSLHAHIEALQATGALDQVFDTVVASKDDIDRLVPDLIDRVARGENIRGFLALDSGSIVPPTKLRRRQQAPPALPVFTPAPILHTRLSPRRCYWSRCTFCTQNAKYTDPHAPRASDMFASLERLGTLVEAGYRNIIFSDEAISPAMLRRMSEEIIRRGLKLRWACRCKLEKSFTTEVFELAARAGCYEILVGLETISDKLLGSMDKAVEGLDRRGVAAIFVAIAEAGIGVHVNLISGFPGESMEEAEDTVAFVVDVLRDHPNATFRLNPFTIFPDTPISADPTRFGIQELSAEGDMPSAYEFRLSAGTRRQTGPVQRAFAELTCELETGLGWSRVIAEPGGRTAAELYASSGHSSVFKAGDENAMEAARSGWTERPAANSRKRTRRLRAFLTGATGNVGRAVLADLLSRDVEVLALARNPAALNGACDALEGDLADLPDLAEVLDGMDAIIHCASPRTLDRAEALQADIEPTGRLLDAWSTGAFVFTSSQTVYGVPEGNLSEDSTAKPGNWYDLAKLVNERQVGITAEALGGVGVSLRLPLVFGSGPKRRNGQYLPFLLDALRAGRSFLFRDRRALAEFGTVFIGEVDLGRAVSASIRSKTSGSYNLCSGFVTWRQLIDTMAAAVGLTPAYVMREDLTPRPNEFRLPHSRSFYDCSAFARQVGFEPTESLDTIIARFIEAEQSSTPAPCRAALDSPTLAGRLH